MTYPETMVRAYDAGSEGPYQGSQNAIESLNVSQIASYGVIIATLEVDTGRLVRRYDRVDQKLPEFRCGADGH